MVLTHDPLGHIDSYNPYAYAAMDPINFWDPYGLKAGSTALTPLQQKMLGSELAHQDAFDGNPDALIERIPEDAGSRMFNGIRKTLRDDAKELFCFGGVGNFVCGAHSDSPFSPEILTDEYELVGQNIVRTILIVQGVKGVSELAATSADDLAALLRHAHSNEAGTVKFDELQSLQRLIVTLFERRAATTLTFGPNAVSKLRSHWGDIRSLAERSGVELPKRFKHAQPEIHEFLEGIVRTGETRTGAYKPTGGGWDNALWTRKGDAIIIRSPDGQFVTILDAAAGAAAKNYPGGL